MDNSLVVPVLLACVLGGCADQMLGNDRARDSISGSLGLPAAHVTIIERRADGPTNTNFIVDTRANGCFVCTINGGNIAPFGMTNGAFCRRPSTAQSDGGGSWTPMTRTRAAPAASLLGCLGPTIR